MPRDPYAEAIVKEFVRLIGPEGAFLSDREVEAEMRDQGWPLSHERIRQYRGDEWESVQNATLRKLRAYNEWKAARLAIEEVIDSTNPGGGGGGRRRSGGE